jgi:hypothetical protein
VRLSVVAHALSETLPASKAAMIILFIDFLQPVVVMDPVWNPIPPAIPARAQPSNVTKRQAFRFISPPFRVRTFTRPAQGLHWGHGRP